MLILDLIKNFNIEEIDIMLKDVFKYKISYLSMFDVCVDARFGKSELANYRTCFHPDCIAFNEFIRYMVKSVVEAKRKWEEGAILTNDEMSVLKFYCLSLSSRTSSKEDYFREEASRYNRVRWFHKELFAHYAMYSEWLYNSKQVYMVDKDFMEKLGETKSMKVYPKMYENLPYSTFVISSPDEKDLYIVNARVVNSNTLVISYLMNLSSSYAMGFSSGSVEIKADEEYVAVNTEELDYREVMMLQFCTYLISEKPDVTDRMEPASTERKVGKKKLYEKSGTVTISEVGFRYGSAIRTTKVKNNNESTQLKGRKEISPYMRCAHWHSFWTGKKDGSEERKLIVKWLPPTYCAGVLKDAVIHKVIN